MLALISVNDTPVQPSHGSSMRPALTVAATIGSQTRPLSRHVDRLHRWPRLAHYMDFVIMRACIKLQGDVDPRVFTVTVGFIRNALDSLTKIGWCAGDIVDGRLEAVQRLSWQPQAMDEALASVPDLRRELGLMRDALTEKLRAVGCGKRMGGVAMVMLYVSVLATVSKEVFAEIGKAPKAAAS